MQFVPIVFLSYRKIMSDSYYPLPAFYFKVEFSGLGTDADTSFQEVSGLKATVEVEDYKELGENTSVHKLPKALKYSNIILKRGVADSSSKLVEWCSGFFSSNYTNALIPKQVDISLMNENGDKSRTWSLVNAYPVSWAVGSLNSQNNEIAIETIELTYNYFTIT